MTSSILILLSLALLGVSNAAPAAFPAMQPMGKFTAMQQLQNLQKQGQSQGTAAATGDGSADFGTLQSLQNSNTLTGDNGTNTQAGSLGACSGGNCGINGASQISAAGQSQKQGQLANQNIFGSQGGPIAANPNQFGNFFGANNATSQKQKQSQSQISGAAVGQGSVALGNISSIQNTQGLTNNRGAQVGSSSVGQGLGTQVGLSGAVQAKGQNQAAAQQTNQAGQNVNAAGVGGGIQRPNCSDVQRAQKGANAIQHANQSQSQSQGEGASVGQGSAGEGAVNSAQASNVATSNKGTLVSSTNAGQAAGKGLKLSGATSSSGQQANQKQQTLNAQASQGASIACV